jgi:hypothetical protein
MTHRLNKRQAGPRAYQFLVSMGALLTGAGPGGRAASARVVSGLTGRTPGRP